MKVSGFMYVYFIVKLTIRLKQEDVESLNGELNNF